MWKMLTINLDLLLIFSDFYKNWSNELELMPPFEGTWFLSKNLLQSQDRCGGLVEPPLAPGKAFQTSPSLGVGGIRQYPYNPERLM